jgi:hypothetical protein
MPSYNIPKPQPQTNSPEYNLNANNELGRRIISSQFKALNAPQVTGDALISQSKLIIKSYGLQALQTKFYNTGINGDQYNIEQVARQEGDEQKKHSFFGLPVFDVLTFAQKDYETLDREQITVDQFEMGCVLIEVSQHKEIVKTKITGRNGTPKEYIADGDYQISIKGVLAINGIDVFPEEVTQHLIEFCKVPESIQIGSSFLAMFGITDIVIEDYNFPREEGMRNIQKFTIEALSDSPFELKTAKI